MFLPHFSIQLKNLNFRIMHRLKKWFSAEVGLKYLPGSCDLKLTACGNQIIYLHRKESGGAALGATVYKVRHRARKRYFVSVRLYSRR